MDLPCAVVSEAGVEKEITRTIGRGKGNNRSAIDLIEEQQEETR